RPEHGRGDDADLRHLDLRAVQPGRAPGLRVQPQPQPNPLRLRALRRRPGRRQPRLRLRQRPAATATVLDALDSGSHVICMDDVYGGTFRLFERVRRRSAGLDFSFVDLNDMAALEAAVKPNTRLVWCETPTNPLLKIVDIARLAEFCRKRGILLA